jgi:hypothetical protein
MFNSGLLWEMFSRTAKGAPMIVSSNWAAYFISGIIFVFNSVWHFFDLRLPWRERLREVWKSKKKDVFRGSVLLAVFWAILFSASFVRVLDEDRTSLTSLQNKNQQLVSANTILQNQKIDLEKQLAALSFVESPNSLRRRTLRLLNDLTVFWSHRPEIPPQPVPTPSTEEEHQRNARFEQYWRDANTAYEKERFRDRIRVIVNEYKSKGVQTGYLDFTDQNNRFVGSAPFGGTGVEDCSRANTDSCTLRELAYHVDANDNPIILRLDGK